MTKLSKSEAFDRITALRKEGRHPKEIAAELNVSRTRIYELIRLFKIPDFCPHCGLAIREKK